MPRNRIRKQRDRWIWGKALFLSGLLGAALCLYLHSVMALWQASPIMSGDTGNYRITPSYPAVLETSVATGLPTTTTKPVLNIVADFGVKGDGITDDTQTIQQAIDFVYQKGGGTIVFPPRIYLVTSVTLKENITYRGYGAIIKRPAHQDKWTRTFTTHYAGNTNSQPLVIQGFTFDGNQMEQGAYQNYELEQAHLLFLMGDPDFPGRLQAVVEDCVLKNGVADGISVYTNVDVRVSNCEAVNVFRGGFVLTGGNSSAEVFNLTTRGDRDPTGIDIEVDGRGYGNTLKTHIQLENLNLINGDFDIAVAEESVVIGNNVISDAPFYLYSLNSTMQFTHSKFKIGAADEYMNRIVFPHYITFEDCEFTVTRKNTENSHRFYAAADVWWQHPSQPTQRNQLLVFKNCSFQVDSTIRPSDLTYAVYLRADSPSNHNRLVMEADTISNQFHTQLMQAPPR
ncbi:MAG TPA: glycosyl hydrolase family 28-related protein [Coleofasciculaceae cyanobacterium]